MDKKAENSTLDQAKKRALDKQYQAQKDKQDSASESDASTAQEDTPKTTTTVVAAEERTEEQQALEQWLRKIPDDPGGLLRRKMYREYKKRGRENRFVKKVW